MGDTGMKRDIDPSLLEPRRLPISWEQLRMRCTEIGDCMLWNQGTYSTGYPQARIDGRSRLVARYVYSEIMGKLIRKGYVVCTKCEQKLCISPECLISVTYSERLKRSYASGARSTSKEYGARVRRMVEQGRVKCSFEIAADIRANRMDVSTAQLARELGVHQKTAYNIKRGKTWRNAYSGSSVFTLGSP